MMRFYRSAVPQHAHPLVRKFVELKNQERAPNKLIEKRAGLGHDTIKAWTRDATPNLVTFEAALNVLGYKLDIRRIEE